jgi:hypothetical protein
MNELVLSQDFGSTQIDMISVQSSSAFSWLSNKSKIIKIGVQRKKSCAQNTTLCWAENRVADFSITIVHKLQ